MYERADVMDPCDQGRCWADVVMDPCGCRVVDLATWTSFQLGIPRCLLSNAHVLPVCDHLQLLLGLLLVSTISLWAEEMQFSEGSTGVIVSLLFALKCCFF